MAHGSSLGTPWHAVARGTDAQTRTDLTISRIDHECDDEDGAGGRRKLLHDEWPVTIETNDGHYSPIKRREGSRRRRACLASARGINKAVENDLL